MLIRKVLIFCIIVFSINGCKKNNKEAYIQIYNDMAFKLSEFVKILKNIKIENAVSRENHDNAIKIQKEINKIQASVEAFPESMDEDNEIKEKLRDILIKIELYHVYIIKLQNEIKNIDGVEILFNELKKRGSD